MVDIAGELRLWDVPGGGGQGLTGITIDGDGEYCSVICQLPETKTYSAISLRTSTISVSGSLEIRVETVDMATGYPSGNLYDANSSGSISLVAGTDNSKIKYISFAGGGFPGVAGDWVAIKVTRTSGTFSGVIAQYLAGYYMLPYFVNYLNSSYVQGTCIPAIMLIATDNKPYIIRPGFVPNIWNSSLLYVASDHTPLRKGCWFKVPFTFQLRQIEWKMIWGDANLDVMIYDKDAVTILASITLDKVMQWEGNPDTVAWSLSTPITLEKDTYYRLIFKATNTIHQQICGFDLTDYGSPVSPAMTEWPGGENFYYTENTNAEPPTGESSWTQPYTTKRVAVLLVGDNLELEGAGGGGGGIIFL